MKKTVFPLAIFLMLACLFSCEEGIEEPLSAFSGYDADALTQSVYADETTTDAEFTFTASEPWIVTIDDVTKTESWIKVSPMEGKIGKANIEISLYVNRTGAKRTATIFIKAGESEIPITVSQEPLTEKGEEPEPEVLEPNGDGVFTNANKNLSVKLIGVEHEIKASDIVELNFLSELKDGKDGEKFRFTFYNPLSGGELMEGSYEMRDENDNTSLFENGTCSFLKSTILSYGESGTVKVEKKEQEYIFTFNFSDWESTLTGSFTGVPKYLNEEKKVESVTLDITERTLTLGENLSLVATILPEDATNKNYNWSSSDSEVVTVNEDGFVESVAEGTAIITVSTVDGDKTATCNITVNGAVTVESITIAQNEISIFRGESYEFYSGNEVEFIPENAYNKQLTWESSNEEIATYSGKAVYAEDVAGEAIITFTTVDGAKTATLKVTVKERPSFGNITVKDINGESTDEVHSIIEAKHTILPSGSGVKLEFLGYNRDISEINLYNSLFNGRLAAGTYNCRYPEDETNGTFSGGADNKIGAYSAGTVNVAISGDEYTITLDITNTENGYTLAGTYAGEFNYTNEFVEVSSVELPDDVIELHIGDTYNMPATVLPSNAFNRKIVWSSSEPTYATVSNSSNNYGTIVAKSHGTTIITVVTESGAKTASCIVKVIPIPSTGSGTVSHNNGTPINIKRATQERTFDGSKEVELFFFKEDTYKYSLSIKFIKETDYSGSLRAGTYSNIIGLSAEEFSIKYSSSNTGTVTVTKDGDQYGVTLDVTVEGGAKITGSYTGKILE